VNAGFHWSLIGRGNRLSTDEPAGASTGRVRDGYNKLWDFGAGLDANRYALPAQNGTWPNLIQFNLLTTNIVAVGTTNVMKFYYQYGLSAIANATVQVFLDLDLNPLNGSINVESSWSPPRPRRSMLFLQACSFQWNPNFSDSWTPAR